MCNFHMKIYTILAVKCFWAETARELFTVRVVPLVGVNFESMPISGAILTSVIGTWKGERKQRAVPPDVSIEIPF